MFMIVAQMAHAHVTKSYVPLYAFDFPPTDAEKREAADYFGPETCLPSAQLIISRDGEGYSARKPTWDCGPVRGNTIAEVARAAHVRPWAERHPIQLWRNA